MNINEKLNAQNKRTWDAMSDEAKEHKIAEAIIDLAYDTKMSIKSASSVHWLLCRLDDYEALISQQHEALKQLIAERDGVK